MHWNPILLVLRLHVSDTLSAHHQEFVAIHWLCYILCRFDECMLLLVATPSSIWSSYLHKIYQSQCTAKNSWLWAGRLPETCRVIIPIKLDISASVGFIHKESVTMHGHTIVKYIKIIMVFSIIPISDLHIFLFFVFFKQVCTDM